MVIASRPFFSLLSVAQLISLKENANFKEQHFTSERDRMDVLGNHCTHHTPCA